MEVTYKIIGGDGKEYGPVTTDEMRAWMKDGRIGPQTQVWRSDTGMWTSALQYVEFQAELAPLVGQTSLEGFEAVGFWPRVGATLIDGILLSGVILVVWQNVAQAFGWPVEPEVSPNAVQFADFMPIFQYLGRYGLTLYLVKMIYEVIMNGKFGATVGKLIIGARIVRADGSKLGFLFAFLRFFCTMISDCTCYIGYLLVAFRSDKRALHDLIASTRVIYKK